MLKLFLLAVAVCYTCSEAASIRARRTGETCPLFCGSEFRPMCGSNGQTYQNQCEFHKAECRDPTLKLRHTGGCVSTQSPSVTPFTVFYCTTPWCLPIDAPVCGTDAITYRNQCELNNAMCYNRGLRVLHKGTCIGHSF